MTRGASVDLDLKRSAYVQVKDARPGIWFYGYEDSTTITHGISKQTAQAAVYDHMGGRAVRVTSVHRVDQLPRAISAHRVETDVYINATEASTDACSAAPIPTVGIGRAAVPSKQADAHRGEIGLVGTHVGETGSGHTRRDFLGFRAPSQVEN